MTRNVYVGGDVDQVIAAPADSLAALAARTFATVVATDFRKRVTGLTDEIAAARPHLIGLQEISLIRTQSPGDILQGNPTAATHVAYDFLAILMDTLRARGLRYAVAAKVRDTDVELPMATRSAPDDIRLTDYDVPWPAPMCRGPTLASGTTPPSSPFPSPDC